jgi:hypothetical protein
MASVTVTPGRALQLLQFWASAEPRPLLGDVASPASGVVDVSCQCAALLGRFCSVIGVVAGDGGPG